MSLLLFDIDGTLLLRAADAHRDAVHHAIRAVWGIADPAEARIEPAGRTDPEIARAILVQLGVAAARIDAGMADFRIAAGEAYAPGDLRARVAPGMVELLEGLDGDHRLGLVTGNLEAIARRKLRAAGLGRFFDGAPGGFGSDSEDRLDLPPVARARAGDVAPEHTVVIGDTPRDIACARADGVRCLAIATGPYGPAELGDADAVVRAAHELAPLLPGRTSRSTQ